MTIYSRASRHPRANPLNQSTERRDEIALVTGHAQWGFEPANVSKGDGGKHAALEHHHEQARETREEGAQASTSPRARTVLYYDRLAAVLVLVSVTIVAASMLVIAPAAAFLILFLIVVRCRQRACRFLDR